MNKKIAMLEVRIGAKMTETCQTTTAPLQDIKEMVTVVRDSQQKMCRAIEHMSNEL